MENQKKIQTILFLNVILLGVVSALSNQFDHTNINPISADNPTDPNFTCPGNGFFPLSPTACSTTFYNCVGGIAYIYTCPGEGIFDPSQNTCVSPDQAECTQTTTTTATTTNPGPCMEDGFFPLSPEACCSEYLNCFDGEAYITICPAGGVFDPNKRICVPADAADCGFVCVAQDGFYDVPDECSNRYYTCLEGVAYESFCPGNAIFDPDRLVCAAPESVACYYTTTTSTTVTWPYTTQRITTTTFSPPVEFVCPSDNGLYPNPDDCKTFYQCTGGKPYIKTCPTGLYFNPETLVCDYLDNVPSCQ
ncbi:hypothetical protein DAPPUDRAFT_310994 [Daphnia pulex]|uniref:Chitin-binding type-2 domain-containing protein n=1 Tax=Daphnia pulex TaxID=6669 RepID=E9FWA3_DAPPU|nr:hypothetical protein DAPPUDRAFT_310994 [Daphnia pulex]|eukprot:EFX88960.1 hypothetical protein DAPPUDRAFT_310994 [Daphnia pulex]